MLLFIYISISRFQLSSRRVLFSTASGGRVLWLSCLLPLLVLIFLIKSDLKIKKGNEREIKKKKKRRKKERKKKEKRKKKRLRLAITKSSASRAERKRKQRRQRGDNRRRTLLPLAKHTHTNDVHESEVQTPLSPFLSGRKRERESPPAKKTTTDFLSAEQ